LIKLNPCIMLWRLTTCREDFQHAVRDGCRRFSEGESAFKHQHLDWITCW
jgi:hypothetical protein